MSYAKGISLIHFIVPPTYEAKFNRQRLEDIAKTTISKAIDETNCSFSLRLTNNQGIRSLNRDYRGIDQATDVLSFPIGFDDPETGSFYLGDIIISLTMANKQAAQSNTTLQAELEMLMVHGILHLCGYDHDTVENYAAMSNLQDDILQSVQNPLTGSIHAQ